VVIMNVNILRRFNDGLISEEIFYNIIPKILKKLDSQKLYLP